MCVISRDVCDICKNMCDIMYGRHLKNLCTLTWMYVLLTKISAMLTNIHVSNSDKHVSNMCVIMIEASVTTP